MEKRARDLMKFLRSPRLALFLFFSVALLAVYGTFVAPYKAEIYFGTHFGRLSLPLGRFLGLIDTYHSPVFVALFLLILLNLVLCTWRRFSLRAKASEGDPRGRSSLVRRLDLLMHLSVLIILTGAAAKGMWASVGTVNIPVSVSADTVFDWRTRTEVPLGFTIQVRNRVDEYFPPEVRIGVSDAATGKKIGLLEMREGRRVEVPGGDSSVVMLNFNRQLKLLRLAVRQGGSTEVVKLDAGEEGKASVEVGAFTFVLVAWRQDLKMVHSLVVVLKEGRVVREEWLEANSRITYGGASIFQTAWGVDEYRNPYVGLQIARDPGAPVFWAGSILFCIFTPLFLLVRHGSKEPRQRGQDRGPVRHAWSRNVILCLLSTLIVLVAAESAVRILDLGPKRYAMRQVEPKGYVDFITYPDGLFLYPPESTFSNVYDPAGDRRGYFGPDGRIDYHINSYGLRGPEVPVEKPPGTFRVLALGDSITFGEGVRYEDTYAARLEGMLDSRMTQERVEVINAGVQAYGTRHSVALFRSRVMPLDPDVVILGFFLNDVMDKEETIRHFEASIEEIKVPFPARVSRLWEILHTVLHSRKVEREFLSATRASFQGEEWEHVKGLFGEMKELSKERKFRFVVAIFPVLTELGENYPLTDIHALVADALDRAGCEYVDLLDVFRGLPADSLWVHPTDHHPNEIAHRIAAEEIAAYLAGGEIQ